MTIRRLDNVIIMSHENPRHKENVILNLTLLFSLGVIAYCETLESNRKFVVARQLLKSATSIGANTREAQNAESKSDFIHKLKIALKEVDETEYWLLLCRAFKNLSVNRTSANQFKTHSHGTQQNCQFNQKEPKLVYVTPNNFEQPKWYSYL